MISRDYRLLCVYYISLIFIISEGIFVGSKSLVEMATFAPPVGLNVAILFLKDENMVCSNVVIL